MAGNQQQGGGHVGPDFGREPCPDRIVDDIGGAFGMGAVGGGIWHLIKGMKNSPRNSRMRGGLEVSLLCCVCGMQRCCGDLDVQPPVPSTPPQQKR